MKSTQLSIFPFAPIKQIRHEEVVIASGQPHDDRYAEKAARETLPCPACGEKETLALKR